MGERESAAERTDGFPAVSAAGRSPEPADARSSTAGEGGRPTDRDPMALAAWRRVAEQRRRRLVAEGAQPVDGVDALDVPGAGATVARAEPVARAGADRPLGPVPDRHEVLLGLAGRIDDDALSAVREMVAIEDVSGAAELLGGCLLAGRVGVTATERDALDGWFSGARVDPGLVSALPADTVGPHRSVHRFVAAIPPGSTTPAGTRRDGETVARVAQRLPGVRRVRQCWRLTPAGAAPGPVPHLVVLVETESADDRENVTHHVAHAARALGTVSVEVFAVGADLPCYHRDALTVAVPLMTTEPITPNALASDPGTPRALRSELLAPDALASELLAPDALAPEPLASELLAPDALASEFLASELLAPDPESDEEPFVVDVGSGAGEDWHTVADSATRGAAPVPTEEPTGRGVPALGPDLRDHPAMKPPSDRSAEPDVADLDPDAAAARIAALWAQPSAVDVFDAPLDGPLEPAGLEPAGFEPRFRGDELSVGMPTDGLPALPPGGDDADDADLGRVRRARHSRGGEDDASDPLGAPDAGIPMLDDGYRGDPYGRGRGTSGGPHPDPLLGPDRRGGEHRDPETGPVDRRGGPGRTGERSGRSWSDPTPTDPNLRRPAALEPSSSDRPSPEPSSAGQGPRSPSEWNAHLNDTGDAVASQLSDRERELLARLHEELAARERLDPGAADPLVRGGTDPRTEDHLPPVTPADPPPRRRNGHVNGHVNGHDLPRRFGPSTGLD